MIEWLLHGDHETLFSVKKKKKNSSNLQDWSDMKVSKQGGKQAPNTDNNI